jgi:hypothetical protein
MTEQPKRGDGEMWAPLVMDLDRLREVDGLEGPSPACCIAWPWNAPADTAVRS